MKHKPQPPTIAVTGATGWIGTRLCKVAQARGHVVRLITRDILRSPKQLRIELTGCECVVHLAAQVHQSERRPDDGAYLQVNVELTRQLAQAAAEASIRRFVFVSTAKVIGAKTTGAATEMQSCSPPDEYSRSKLQAENLLLSEESTAKPPEVLVVRPPLVYGPGVRANFLALLKLADSPWPLPLASANSQRSLVFIDNLIDALLFLCVAPYPTQRVFFVSDERDSTVAELVRDIRSHLGRPARLFRVPAYALQLLAVSSKATGGRVSRVIERLFSPLQVSSAALHELGWSPPVGNEKAISETVQGYRLR